MAHPENPEAVGVAVTDVDSAAAALSEIDFGFDEPQPVETPEPEEHSEADDAELELEGEGEQDDEADEPETAITPPVSLNAEEKKAFAQLPTEAQQLLAAVETRRNAQVQEATTKASEAQRTADARAAAADADAKALYAAQMGQVLKAIEPTPPDPRQYSDQLAYLTDDAQYRAEKAQHDQFAQQVAGMHEEANTEAEQAWTAQRARDLMAIPEVANPETREAFFERVGEVAEALGYNRDILTNRADSADFKAIALAAEWKAKADRFDKASAVRMQKVRAAKGKSLRPNAAQPSGSGQQRAFSEANQRLRSSGSVEDAAAALRGIL